MFGCEQDFHNREACSIQGFNELKSKIVSCEEGITVNSVDFSNGNSRDLIHGIIKINDVDYSFNLIMDSVTVVDYTFDFLNVDSTNYDCSFKKKDSDYIDLEWTSGTNRVFLRKRITSVH